MVKIRDLEVPEKRCKWSQPLQSHLMGVCAGSSLMKPLANEGHFLNWLCANFDWTFHFSPLAEAIPCSPWLKNLNIKVSGLEVSSSWEKAFLMARNRLCHPRVKYYEFPLFVSLSLLFNNFWLNNGVKCQLNASWHVTSRCHKWIVLGSTQLLCVTDNILICSID